MNINPARKVQNKRSIYRTILKEGKRENLLISRLVIAVSNKLLFFHYKYPAITSSNA